MNPAKTKSLVFIARAGIVLALLVSASTLAVGTAMWLRADGQRPPTTLERMAPAGRTAEADPPANRQDPVTHHVPREVPHRRAATPTPSPELEFRHPVVIRTLHQDTGVLADNLVAHMERNGGHVTTNRGDSQSRGIRAIVPSGYVEDIEPLLRRTTEHINPHYAAWNEQAVRSTGRHRALPEPDSYTQLKFRVAGRRIEDPGLDRRAKTLVWTGTAGTMLTICAVAAMLTAVRPPQDRKTARQGERATRSPTH